MPGPQTARNYCMDSPPPGGFGIVCEWYAIVMKAFLDKESMVREEARICLIRHGETAWNAELRIQGHRDLPLNGSGLAQAEALAGRLAGQRFDALYSSDLLRARQTAQPLADVLGLPVRLEPELRERHFGCCEGKTREEILAYMEGKIAKWWMPDDVMFVDSIPHTATGKILKTALREQFKDYSLPTAAA